jgi:hypothetical protein
VKVQNWTIEANERRRVFAVVALIASIKDNCMHTISYGIN